MSVHVRNLGWFYEQGYICYVLSNTSQEEYLKVQQHLSSNGIKVLKSATSCRPASNGFQYKWYIRVEGENFKAPSREQITSIDE